MDLLGVMLIGIALIVGVSTGNWFIDRTGKKYIGWPLGTLIFLVCLVVLRKLI